MTHYSRFQGVRKAGSRRPATVVLMREEQVRSALLGRLGLVGPSTTNQGSDSPIDVTSEEGRVFRARGAMALGGPLPAVAGFASEEA